MKAMVLAAGVGSRLAPLTDALPKALVEVGGKTMLESVLGRLKEAGVTEAVVNAFHLADRLEAYLRENRGFGLRIEVSREEVLLDTGGGLKKAASFFDDGKPFFVHNVDVLSGIDLRALYAAHLASEPLATLAVQDRPSPKRLLFSPAGLLCGRQGETQEWARGPVPGAKPLGFAGIHVVSPALFPKLKEQGVFPILDAYLRLAGEGEAFRAFRCDGALWHDIGTAAKLEAARRALASGGPR